MRSSISYQIPACALHLYNFIVAYTNTFVLSEGNVFSTVNDVFTLNPFKVGRVLIDNCLVLDTTQVLRYMIFLLFLIHCELVFRYTASSLRFIFFQFQSLDLFCVSLLRVFSPSQVIYIVCSYMLCCYTTVPGYERVGTYANMLTLTHYVCDSPNSGACNSVVLC